MTRRNENHGLSGCVGSPYCVDCGGLCSCDDLPSGPPRDRPCAVPVVKVGYRYMPESSQLCECGWHMFAHKEGGG